MKDYLFVLGRNYLLSLEELFSYFKRKEIQFRLRTKGEGVAVFSLPDLDFNRVIEELGGTVKICEVIIKTSTLDEIEYSLDKISLYKGKSDKIKYAVGDFGSRGNCNFVKNYLKRRFKEGKLKVNLISSKQNKHVMPSDFIKKDLFNNGVELICFKDYVCKTIAVFDPFKVKERDLKRPKHDYKRESSIRLAKILVNLSEVKEKHRLLDPFCGYGVILQEALLLNINVIGQDNDKKVVEDCKQNLKWAKKKYNIGRDFKVVIQDSTESLEGADVCVTEPYLGPFFKTFPTLEEAKKIRNRLEVIYDKILKLLRGNVRKIVFVVPEFKTKNRKIVDVHFDRILKRYGFRYKYIKFEEGFLDRYIYIAE